MKQGRWLVVLGICLWCSLGMAMAQNASWRYDFETADGPSLWQGDANSRLSISTKHYKDGKQSLKWDWKTNSRLRFTDPAPNRKDALNGFRAWVYNEQALDATLTFRFGTPFELDANNPRYQFQFGLNFTGWRAMWIDLPQDATHASHTGSKNGRATAFEILSPSSVPSGSVFLDLMELVEKIHWARSADAQVPFVNASRDGGRDPYYRWSLNTLPDSLVTEITDAERQAFKGISDRYEAWVFGQALDQTREPVRIRLDALADYIEGGYDNLADFALQREGDRVIGKPLFASRSPYKPYFRDVLQDVLMRLVLDYRVNGNLTARDRVLDVFDYLYDQGWAAGSSIGTLDHTFLRLASYAHAVYLMREDLRATGRLARELATLEWHSMFGELYEAEWEPGTNADFMRTVAMHRLLRILMMEDTPEKAATMRRYVAWFNNALSIAPGWLDTIKPDFTGFHHRGIYANAYAPNGFHVASLLVYLLHDTPFAVADDRQDNLKQALLTARVMANTYDVSTAINGRFPFKTAVINEILPAYMYMALSYAPIDSDLSGAFMRLWKPESSALKDGLFSQVSSRIMYLNTPGAMQMMVDFADRGLEPEVAPFGHWTLPYGALSIHRRDEWMVSLKGWSKYVWDFESSGSGENQLGRYLSYGSMLIYSEGDPVSPAASGIVQAGWDWSMWPGTTVIQLSHAELNNKIEHRNFSDQTFVGGVDLEGQNGVFALKLHDTVHDTSFRATKSVFFFDNMLVCLGSDIRNQDRGHPTVTPLFQAALSNGRSTFVNGQAIQTMPYAFRGTTGQSVWLMDTMGNGYVVPDGGGLQVKRQVQNPGDYGKEGGGEGPFELAWIDHGRAPQGAAYEYALLVQSSADAVQRFAETPVYEIWQKDHRAHIVHHRDLHATGYALFDSRATPLKGPIAGVTLPSLLMTRDVDDGLLLAAADPDYGWSREIGAPHDFGSLIPNQSSEPRTLQVTIKGIWTLDRAYDRARIVDVKPDRTVVAFTCQDGKTVEVKLVKTAGHNEDTSRLDFDADGVIGFGDFVQFAGHFGMSISDAGFDAAFDIDGDGTVGFSDFLIFAGGFGKPASGDALAVCGNIYCQPAA